MQPIQPSSNKFRTALHSGLLPPGPLTPGQKAIVAAIAHCNCIADTYSVRSVAIHEIKVCSITLGCSKTEIMAQMKNGIANARLQLDHLDGMLSIYGPSIFGPQVEPDLAPPGHPDDTQHSVLIAIMKQQHAAGRVMVRAGDHAIVRGNDGNYELV